MLFKNEIQGLVVLKPMLCIKMEGMKGMKDVAPTVHFAQRQSFGRS